MDGAAPGMDGSVKIGFAGDGSTTRLKTLYQRAPLRALFPTPPAGDPITAVIATTSGGLVGGDQLAMDVSMSGEGQALVTTQAAEKIYRSLGPNCDINVALDLDGTSALEWMPQETILFDGGRLNRKTAISMDGNSRLLAGDILVFGRTAHGERIHVGFVRDAWTLSIDGDLVWADALHMDEDLDSILKHPACFDGAVAYATMLYVAPDAPSFLAAARELLPQSGVNCAATVVGPVLITRWLAQDALHLRSAFGLFWSQFREVVFGLPVRLPRVWSI
jgi:urease accessory protein